MSLPKLFASIELSSAFLDEVVHEYGDVCQAITELAGERDQDISVGEFRIFNRCLDNAIADAVTSFELACEVSINDQAVTLEASEALYDQLIQLLQCNCKQ